MPETAYLGAKIAPKSMSAGASPQTPLKGAYSAPPDPLAGFKGPTPKERGGEEGEGKTQKNCAPRKIP